MWHRQKSLAFSKSGWHFELCYHFSGKKMPAASNQCPRLPMRVGLRRFQLESIAPVIRNITDPFYGTDTYGRTECSHCSTLTLTHTYIFIYTYMFDVWIYIKLNEEIMGPHKNSDKICIRAPFTLSPLNSTHLMFYWKSKFKNKNYMNVRQYFKYIYTPHTTNH